MHVSVYIGMSNVDYAKKKNIYMLKKKHCVECFNLKFSYPSSLFPCLSVTQ